MRRLALYRLFIRIIPHIWVSLWPNKTKSYASMSNAWQTYGVWVHVLVWEYVCVCVLVCVEKHANVFVIKITEYKGEVPLEGWVATYLQPHYTHRHTHTQTHTLTHRHTHTISFHYHDILTSSSLWSLYSSTWSCYFIKAKNKPAHDLM